MIVARSSLRFGSLALLSALLLAAGPADTPVAEAAQRGDVEAVRSLLQQGADANAAQADGMTALHWAAQNDQAEIAQILLYAGATSRARTRLGGYTPLHLASRAGNAGVVGVLLEGGADPNAVTTTGVTALHFAAEADAPEVTRKLIAHGGNVDAADSFSDRTPLMFAAVRGSNAAVVALMEGGADASLMTRVKDFEEIDRVNREEMASRQRMREAAMPPAPDPEDEEETADPPAEAPPEQEPDPEPEEEPEPEPAGPPIEALSSAQQIGRQGGFTALHYAAREGHIETARQLVLGGADVNQVTDGDQSSPLLVAVINGNYDLARLLMEQGADPNLVSDDGAGPLFATLNIEWSLRTWYPQPSAFRQQETTYLDLMALLIAAGANPNQRTGTHIWYAAYNAGRMGVDFTGATPFWRAAYARDVAAMRLLIDAGADPNIWTLKLPERRRNSDPNFPGNRTDPDEEEELDPSGLPEVPVGGPAIHPFHAAAGVGFGTSRVAQQHRSVPGGALPSLQYMIEELGIDPNLRDKDGYNAIHHSAARGDNASILYLVDQGVDILAISRRGQTTADMANSPEQRAQPIPATVALLEKLGSANSHKCASCGNGG